MGYRNEGFLHASLSRRSRASLRHPRRCHGFLNNDPISHAALQSKHRSRMLFPPEQRAPKASESASSGARRLESNPVQLNNGTRLSTQQPSRALPSTKPMPACRCCQEKAQIEYLLCFARVAGTQDGGSFSRGTFLFGFSGWRLRSLVLVIFWSFLPSVSRYFHFSFFFFFFF